MKNTLLAFLMTSISIGAHAMTFGVNAGPERWHFTGNQLENGATGFMGNLLIRPEPSDSNLPSSPSFSIKFGSASVEPKDSSIALDTNKAVKFSSLRFGPEFCRPVVGLINICGGLGLTLVSINQSNFTHNDMRSAYASFVVQSRVWHKMFLRLSSDLSRFSERQMGQSVNLGTISNSIAIGTDF